MPSSPSADDLEEREVLVVELVVGEAGAQRRGALLGEVLVEVGEPLGEVVVDDARRRTRRSSWCAEVWCARSSGCGATDRRAAQRITSITASTVCSKSRSVESTVVDAGRRRSGSRRPWSPRRRAGAAASADGRGDRRRRAPRSAARFERPRRAVSRMRTGASGATTVVMSRPSTTTPGRGSSATMPRNSSLRCARTSGTRATPLTAAVTRGSRIAVGDVGRRRPARSSRRGRVPMRVVEVAEARRGRMPRRRRVDRRARARARRARGTRRRCRGSRSRAAGRPALRDARLAAAGGAVDGDDDAGSTHGRVQPAIRQPRVCQLVGRGALRASGSTRDLGEPDLGARASARGAGPRRSRRARRSRRTGGRARPGVSSTITTTLLEAPVLAVLAGQPLDAVVARRRASSATARRAPGASGSSSASINRVEVVARARRARRRPASAFAPRICTHSSGSLPAMRVVSRTPWPGEAAARAFGASTKRRASRLATTCGTCETSATRAVVLLGRHLDAASRRGRGSRSSIERRAR